MKKAYTKERYERTKKLQDAEEDTMRVICASVADGGSLIDLCDEWDVIHGEMAAWIRADKERSRRVNESKNDRAEWYIEKIRSVLNQIATVDIREMFAEDGSVLEPKEWPKHISCVVKSFDVQERFDKDGIFIGRNYKVNLWSKEKGLELLGKNLSMYIDKHEHSGGLTLEEIVSGSRKKDG